MRLSYRVSSAAALIVFGLILFYRHLKTVEGNDPRSFFTFNTAAFRNALHPASHDRPGNRRGRWRVGTDTKVQLTYQTTPIQVPNTGIIVMAKLKEEDTAWVSAELSEWRNFIYTVDDPNAPVHTPKNKGRESLPYLQYIVDHYNDLPDTMVFLHSHRDGWPGAWHTDTMEYSNVDSVRALQTQFIQREGYANLRCQQTPGCPAEIEPLREPTRPGNEKHYAEAWVQLFNNTDVPEKVGAPCCSQFAVSRDQVLGRPLSDYERMYNWVLTNELPDDITASIMEYSWHIIFGKAPVTCPNVFQCYADVYGEEPIF